MAKFLGLGITSHFTAECKRSWKPAKRDVGRTEKFQQEHATQGTTSCKRLSAAIPDML